MKKFMSAFLLLIILATLQTKVFAASLNCSFKGETKVQGIKSLEIFDDALIVNDKEVIPLEHTSIKCGVFGRQSRFDGIGTRLQIILKSCTDEAALEGRLIDAHNEVVADVVCN